MRAEDEAVDGPIVILLIRLYFFANSLWSLLTKMIS